MKVFATCDLPCHFKINGESLGVIDKNLLTYNLERENPLFEALPLNELFSPCYSGINGSKSIKVFKVDNGVLVCPVLRKNYISNFKMLGQTECVINGVRTILSVVIDGVAKFYLEGCFNDVKTLPFIPEKFEIYYENGFIFVSFSAEKRALFVYELESAKLVFCNVVSAFSYSETLNVKREFQTVLKTTVFEKWNLGLEPTLIERRSETEKSFFEINPLLVPAAFFESVVIGASINEIASPNLVKRYDALREFLGKVIRVIPSPQEDNCVWLITEEKVVKGIVVLENGIIDNVLLDDF